MREKIIYKLANFILVENGNKCIMTHDDLELIKETKQDYEETYSQYEYVIKSFGVKVIKKQAIDSIVLKWEKVPGSWSLWQVMD